MKTFTFGMTLIGLMAVAACSNAAAAGPNGGDVVSIKGGTAYAELVSNEESGEMMVQTWDKNLKTRRPIEREPISVGSGDNKVELTPYPTDNDPEGMSSRFYGQADWARGAGVHQGWMEGRATGDRQQFEWRHGREAGRTQRRMWEEMGEHRRMGTEHGPGARGPMHR